jgi:predicted ester cyclase
LHSGSQSSSARVTGNTEVERSKVDFSVPIWIGIRSDYFRFADHLLEIDAGELWYPPENTCRSEVHPEKEEIIMMQKTTSITDVAEAFFDACETGKGWEVCRAYCTLNATFSAQAEPLLDVKTLAQYTDWMKGMLTVLPDAQYDVKSFATDSSRNNVAAYGIFYGTHTGQGGPVPPTGRKISTDYVYIMQFDGDRIAHMTKVWNAGLALKDLGWA